MNDLQITDAAIRACALAIDPDEDPSTLAPEDIAEIRDALVAAAPFIVAAELRRLANSEELVNLTDRFGGTTGDLVQEWLLNHADESEDRS